MFNIHVLNALVSLFLGGQLFGLFTPPALVFMHLNQVYLQQML